MLYLPVACPGSGKSYVGQEMVEAEIIQQDAVVSPDRYREILTNERANQTANKEVFKIVDTILDSRISRGLDVYLDATNLNAKLRNKLILRVSQLSLDFSLPLTILVSDSPKWLVKHRNLDRLHPVPDDVFERFWGLAEAFDPQRYIDTLGANVLTFDDMLDRCAIEEIIKIDNERD
jgi:predicted kinase